MLTVTVTQQKAPRRGTVVHRQPQINVNAVKKNNELKSEHFSALAFTSNCARSGNPGETCGHVVLILNIIFSFKHQKVLSELVLKKSPISRSGNPPKP